jgi:PAS domain S-box-containing protein
MRMTISKKLWLGFGAILIFMCLISGIVLVSTNQVQQGFELVVEEGLPILLKSEKYMKSFENMHQNHIGFCVTGSKEYLEGYENATQLNSLLLGELLELSRHDTKQNNKLRETGKLINEWEKTIAVPEMDLAKRVYKDKNEGVKLKDVLSSGKGKGILDNFRITCNKMIDAFNLDGNVSGENLVRSILKSQVDKETGQRGYLITGNEVFLDPYKKGSGALNEEIKKLRILVSKAHDRKATTQNILKLRKMAAQWRQEAGEAEINLRRQLGKGIVTQADIEEALRNGKGKSILDSMRKIIESMEAGFVKAQNDRGITLLVRAGKAMVDQETGQRGFIITGKEEFLEPYINGEKALSSALTELSELNSNAYDLTAMEGNINKLVRLTEEWEEKAARPEIKLRRQIAKSEKLESELDDIIAKDKGSNITKETVAVFSDFIAQENVHINNDLSSVQKATDFTVYLTIIFVLLSVLVCILTAVFLSKSISKPIRYLTDVSKDIANKNLDINIEVKENRTDEIGDLAKSFRLMIKNLSESIFETEQKIRNLETLPAPVLTMDKDYTLTYMNTAAERMTGVKAEKAVGQKCYDLFKTEQCQTEKCACRQAMAGNSVITEETVAKPGDSEINIRYTGAPIKDASGKTSGALEFILDISDEEALTSTIIEGSNKLSASITEISATIAQLAANTTETSSAIDEITTTVTEVKQVSENAHERAVEVTEKAEQVNAIADEGKGATEDTVEGILKIKEEMASIAESTIKLGEQTQNIGEIISSVNSLADQSNLLSVNASIEAAKAGEFGKGFAVVAREVKALAEQSKSATKQINSILTDIQKATSSAVMATERGTNAVSSGEELSSSAGESITKLADSIQESAESALQIAASSQQQLAGMDQLSKALESITTATKQNLSGTQQLEEASKAMAGLADNLKNTIDNLKK